MKRNLKLESFVDDLIVSHAYLILFLLIRRNKYNFIHETIAMLKFNALILTVFRAKCLELKKTTTEKFYQIQMDITE